MGAAVNHEQMTRPTESEIETRAREIVQDIFDLPERLRRQELKRRRDALDEAKEAVALLEHAKRIGFDRYDPQEVSDAKDIADYYPGYREEDIRRLIGLMPKGLDKKSIISEVISATVMVARMKAYSGHGTGDDPLKNITGEGLQDSFGPANPLLAQLSEEDWSFAAEFIRSNPNIDLNNLDDVLSAQLGGAESLEWLGRDWEIATES